jgi:hypothetical protein
VAGAVHVGGGVNSASVRDTTISDNLLEMTNSVGNANGFSGGLHNDGGIDMTISDVTEANNRVRVSTLGASTGNAAADSGAGEGQGLMTNVRLTGNSVVAYSVHGNAHASAGAGVFAGTVTSSTVTGNDSRASAPHGFADASGGALSVAGALTVRATVIDGNTTHASGNKGSALGGGIFATRFPGGPPAGPIMLINSQVTHNVASTTGLTAHGGGIYTTPDYPVTLTNSVLANNQPDQCFGC